MRRGHALKLTFRVGNSQHVSNVISGRCNWTSVKIANRDGINPKASRIEHMSGGDLEGHQKGKSSIASTKMPARNFYKHLKQIICGAQILLLISDLSESR